MCVCACSLTWGWDSERRADPPRWLWANSDGGGSQASVGQIRENSEGEKKCEEKTVGKCVVEKEI